MVKKEVEKLLKKVQKPARYTGGELNSVVKNKEDVKLRYAFCFRLYVFCLHRIALLISHLRCI